MWDSNYLLARNGRRAHGLDNFVATGPFAEFPNVSDSELEQFPELGRFYWDRRTGGLSGTISATGWAWAFSPRNAMKVASKRLSTLAHPRRGETPVSDGVEPPKKELWKSLTPRLHNPVNPFEAAVRAQPFPGVSSSLLMKATVSRAAELNAGGLRTGCVALPGA